MIERAHPSTANNLQSGAGKELAQWIEPAPSSLFDLVSRGGRRLDAELHHHR